MGNFYEEAVGLEVDVSTPLIRLPNRLHCRIVSHWVSLNPVVDLKPVPSSGALIICCIRYENMIVFGVVDPLAQEPHFPAPAGHATCYTAVGWIMVLVETMM